MYAIRKEYTKTATNTNEGLKANTVYYIGKKDIHLTVDEIPNIAQLETFGFKTKASATKAFNIHKDLAEKETNKGYWLVNVELIKF